MTPPQKIAPFLREIGCGRDGALALGVTAARGLMSALRHGAASDLEVGALAIGVRMTGVTVADARRLPRLAVWVHGQARADLGSDPTEATLAALPALQRDIDARATALWIRGVLAGDTPLPQPIEVQCRRIVQAVLALANQPGPGAAPTA